MVPLVLLLVLGVMQLALTLWVRTTLIDAAGAGAHAAAMANASPFAAENTVRGALSSTLGSGYVKEITVKTAPIAKVSNAIETRDVDVIEVRLRAPAPVLGLFSLGTLNVVGHAAKEVGP